MVFWFRWLGILRYVLVHFEVSMKIAVSGSSLWPLEYPPLEVDGHAVEGHEDVVGQFGLQGFIVQAEA